MSSSFKSRNWQNAPKVSSGSASSLQESSEREDLCPLFDTAMFLMIEREESLLGEIVQECNEVMDNAREQADEVADDIEYGL